MTMMIDTSSLTVTSTRNEAKCDESLPTKRRLLRQLICKKVDSNTEGTLSDTTYFLEPSSEWHDPSGRRSCLKVKTHEYSLEQAYEMASHKKTVAWSGISIHEHEYCIGDNPAVSSGPPVSISWKPFSTHQISVDEYELHKPEPRRKQQLLLPRWVREDRLRACGYSRSDMNLASQAAETIRVERLKNANSVWDKMRKWATHSRRRNEIAAHSQSLRAS